MAISTLDYIFNKLSWGFWVGVAGVTLYLSNFFLVIWEHSQVNQEFFGLTLILFGLFSSLLIYASFGVPAGVEIEDAVPYIIPTMTVIGVACFITSHAAFWPVWGWWTPPIILLILNGYLNAAHFTPKNSLGSIVFIAYVVIGLLSWRVIPHAGHLHDL